MKVFDGKGMMIFPSSIKKEIRESKKILVVNECFCQNGHNLVSNRAIFNGFNGIMIKVKRGEKEGLVALSPIYGDKSRISLDIDLISNEIYELCCPTCGSILPVYSACTCGGNLIALFTNRKADFANCIGICNRVDCPNAEIRSAGDLLSISTIEAL